MTARPLAPLDQYAPGQHGIVREIKGGADFIGRLARAGAEMAGRGHGRAGARGGAGRTR